MAFHRRHLAPSVTLIFYQGKESLGDVPSLGSTCRHTCIMSFLCSETSTAAPGDRPHFTSGWDIITLSQALTYRHPELVSLFPKQTPSITSESLSLHLACLPPSPLKQHPFQGQSLMPPSPNLSWIPWLYGIHPSGLPWHLGPPFLPFILQRQGLRPIMLYFVIRYIDVFVFGIHIPVMYILVFTSVLKDELFEGHMCVCSLVSITRHPLYAWNEWVLNTPLSVKLYKSTRLF